MSECSEISGIFQMALYSNDNVRFNYTDITSRDTIDIIDHDGYTIMITNDNKPRWSKEIGYSENYRQSLKDTFTFYTNGLSDEKRNILDTLRCERKGFIAEIHTLNDEVFVFPEPVFVVENYEKANTNRVIEVVMSYKLPTFKDKLKKTNKLIMSETYIWLGGSDILGAGGGVAIVSE